LLDQETYIQDQQSREIVNWLTPLNFWLKQDDTFERHQEGTGEWLLNDPSFREWINGGTKVLWCPGDRTLSLQNIANLKLAGVGKTILAYRPHIYWFMM
jgi:hypothetical protein